MLSGLQRHGLPSAPLLICCNRLSSCSSSRCFNMEGERECQQIDRAGIG